MIAQTPEKHMTNTRLSQLLLLVGALGCAFWVVPAQALPLLAQANTGTATTQPTTPPAAPTAEEAPALLPQLLLGISLTNLDVDGNERRFRQYVTPPEGLYISELGLHEPGPGLHSLLDLNVVNLGASDSTRGDVWLAADNGTMVVRGQLRRSEFFRDWTPDSNALRRSDGKGDVALRTGDSELLVNTRGVSLFEAAPDAEQTVDWRDDTPGGLFTTYLGGWRARGGISREEFTFFTGPQVNGEDNRMIFQLSPPDSTRNSLQANVDIDNTGLDTILISPKRTRASLEGLHAFSDNLSISGELFQDEIDDNLARSEYAKRNAGLVFRGDYLGLRNVSLDFGGGSRDVDYIIDDLGHSYRAVENSFFGRARVRLSRALILRATHAQSWTNDRPPISEDDSNSLVWSSKRDQRIELSYAPAWNAGITASWQGRKWRNLDFNTANSVTEQSLFAWWLPINPLTLYASALKQNYGLRGITNASSYLTNDNTISIGGSLQLNPQLAFDADLTGVDGNGAESTNQRTLSLGLSYLARSGDRWALRLARDDFDTAVAAPTLDYLGNWFELRYTKAAF